MPTEVNDGVPSGAERALHLLLEPLRLFLDPGERIFAGFLLSAALIAALSSAWRLRSDAASRRSALGALAARLWHPSARLDYQLLLLKAWLRPLVVAPIVVQAISVMALTAALLELAVGAPLALSAPRWLVATAYTAAAFVVDDATRYLLHRLLHRSPRLWQIHQVHHSAEVLTPLTLHRIHPLESLLYAFRASLSTGVVAGVFYFAFRDQFGGLEVLGVNALGFAFNVLGSNLRHSHVYLSYGSRLERWFISPAQHQIHHSRASRHHDRNFGSFLALWDRMGGTLYPAEGERRHRALSLGLAEGAANHGFGIGSALVSPVRAALRPSRRSSR